jgi:hypothetical protein
VDGGEDEGAYAQALGEIGGVGFSECFDGVASTQQILMPLVWRSRVVETWGASPADVVVCLGAG